VGDAEDRPSNSTLACNPCRECCRLWDFCFKPTAGAAGDDRVFVSTGYDREQRKHWPRLYQSGKPFSARYQYKTAPGTGSVKGTIRTVTTDTLYLRSDFTFDLGSPWKVVFRSDLPFVAKDPISLDHPSGDYLYGMGDADFQAALIEQINGRWAAGGGLRIIAPTGPDNITSGKWQMMPIVGARTMLPELSAGSYFEGLVRYDLSFAGDPTKKNISNLQLDPMLNISLPDRWFFMLYPSADIRVNYGDPVIGQTGRLFLPFDFSVGRSLSKNFRYR